ncbi:hypothetical protein D3C85_1367930 [compost metagenome]
MHHLFGVFEFMHAAAAGQQFIDGLRAAQKHQPGQDDLRRYQFQGLVDLVFPAVGAAAHHQSGEAASFKGAQAMADLARCEVHHRLAAGFLVAGNHQGIEGQGIGFRAGGLFLDQRTQNADFRAAEPWLVESRLLLSAHGSASLADSCFSLA